MDEDFGTSVIGIEDDEGNSFMLEVLGSVEYQGQEYRVFLPADMDVDDPDYGYIILKVLVVDNEEQFANVDDEEEMQAVYEEYMRCLFDGEDEE